MSVELNYEYLKIAFAKLLLTWIAILHNIIFLNKTTLQLVSIVKTITRIS